MAEIEIERRPRRRPLSWIALLLVLSAVALGAWLMLRDDNGGGDAAPAAETTVEQPVMGEAPAARPMGTGPGLQEEGTDGAVVPWPDEPVPGGEPVPGASR